MDVNRFIGVLNVDGLCQNPTCFSEPHWHGLQEDLNNPKNYIMTTHWVGNSQHRTLNKETKMELDFVKVVRKPFVVEAVEITVDNIAEVAKYVGEIREKETDGSPYIYVDRRLVPNIYRVFPGYYMTRMGDQVRCYSKKVFFDQFVQLDENIQAWVDFLNGNEEKGFVDQPATPTA